MSKKNRKANKATTASKSLSIVRIDTSKDTFVIFNAMHNEFRCKCGGRMSWEGGRFAPKSLRHTMEVIRCSKCHQAIDPSLVFETAMKTLSRWEAAKAEYYKAAANKAAANYLKEARAVRTSRTLQTQTKVNTGLFGFVRSFFAA